MPSSIEDAGDRSEQNTQSLGISRADNLVGEDGDQMHE